MIHETTVASEPQHLSIIFLFLFIYLFIVLLSVITRSIYFTLIYQFRAMKSPEPPPFFFHAVLSVPSAAFTLLFSPLFHHPSAVSLSQF